MLEEQIKVGHASNTINSQPDGVRSACCRRKNATDDLWLSPTAEVPITNYRDETQQRICPSTTLCLCFSTEAGSYGRDTRGLIRHQFNKVELFKFVHPDTSEHQTPVQNAEAILQALQLPYRIVECVQVISALS